MIPLSRGSLFTCALLVGLAPASLFAADKPKEIRIDWTTYAFDFVKRRVLAALDRSLDRGEVTDDRETKANAGAELWW